MARCRQTAASRVQGKSAAVLTYRLWTRLDNLPHPGHALPTCDAAGLKRRGGKSLFAPAQHGEKLMPMAATEDLDINR
jgi:hypothetical protein